MTTTTHESISTVFDRGIEQAPALRDSLANGELEDTLRRVMREELHNAG